MMRTRDEIEQERVEIEQDDDYSWEHYVSTLLKLNLEVLLDCRELLSEHAIAHHLLKPELKAEIAEMIMQVVKEADSHV